jgi:AGZA family xanthine/uracil permease-like MFS transporter
MLATSLDRFFSITERRSSVGREVVAGATTFVAAAYLTVVIPGILASGGIDRAAVTTSCIALFIVGTLGMAFYAKLPLVVGPGVGGAALIATTLVLTEHVPWPTALGIAFWAGATFLVLTLLGLRAVVVRIVPAAVKTSLSAAIGVFIAVLGFRNAGLVIANPNINALTLGDVRAPGAVIALAGLAVAVAWQAQKLPGGLLLGVFVASVAGIPFGVTKLPASIIGIPHSLAPVALKLDVIAALRPQFFPYLFAFLAAEFFSTMGTTLAVGGEAGWLDEHGNMPGINGPFVVDSCAATVGPLVGVPALTALIESAAGVQAGGRTGLASVVTAALFLLTLVFAPLILAVPKEATAPALILVGLGMFSNLQRVNLRDFAAGLPAVLTVLVTLIANNFGTGIAAGIVSYVFVQVLAGKAREVPPGLYLLTAPLIYFFWVMSTKH